MDIYRAFNIWGCLYSVDRYMWPPAVPVMLDYSSFENICGCLVDMCKPEATHAAAAQRIIRLWHWGPPLLSESSRGSGFLSLWSTHTAWWPQTAQRATLSWWRHKGIWRTSNPRWDQVIHVQVSLCTQVPSLDETICFSPAQRRQTRIQVLRGMYIYCITRSTTGCCWMIFRFIVVSRASTGTVWACWCSVGPQTCDSFQKIIIILLRISTIPVGTFWRWRCSNPNNIKEAIFCSNCIFFGIQWYINVWWIILCWNT